MNYNEALNYVESTAKFGMKLGLERMNRIMEYFDNPQENIKTIHIAGTNGKGSTTSMLSSILKEAGYKVAMYTSPYIETFEERMQINNENISKEDFAKIITDISEVIPKIEEEGYGTPTYFEIITSAAFIYFEREKVDYAVIEVGLGGRLDATNIIRPILSIITSISFDHTMILGNTLKEITKEKCGIIKEGIRTISYPQEEEAMEVIKAICKERNSKLIEIHENSSEFLEVIKTQEGVYQKIKIEGLKEEYNVNLALLGKHQVKNASVVLYAVEELSNLGLEIEDKHILEGLKKVRWIGRLETMQKDPFTVIDGAHNIGGILSLKESLNTYFKYNNVILILGILADKEVEKMVMEIAPLCERVICVTPQSDRAELSEDLKQVVLKYNENCEAIENYEDAYKKAIEYYNEGDMILCSGSLYMIGDMRKIIKRY